jgi:hypothetical protein
MALALNAMGDKFEAILDVTIVYPDGPVDFGAFLRGKLHHVVVRVRALPVPQDLVQGDYENDPAVREAYQRWVQTLWQAKEATIENLIRP